MWCDKINEKQSNQQNIIKHLALLELFQKSLKVEYHNWEQTLIPHTYLQSNIPLISNKVMFLNVTKNEQRIISKWGDQDLLKALRKSFIYGFVFKVINDRAPCSKAFASNSRGINLWK